MEQPLLDAFAINAIPVFVDNQAYTDSGPDSEFALVRIQFGLMNEPVIGCNPIEFVRGVTVVELYTPKGTGPGRPLSLIQPVLQVLAATGGLRGGADAVIRYGRTSGPSMTPLDDRPHLLTSLSAGFRARYDGP